MASVPVERLDHLGLVACMIKDLGLIRMIDARLIPDAQEEITPGEAVAGMLLNGVGFANRPLSLTPQFLTNTPLDLLCRPGVRAEMFNRFKLGRTLDEVHADGCELWFSEVALAVCAQDSMEQRFHHLDTTSFSGCVANFAQGVMKGQVALSVERLCREGVEQLSHREVLVSLLSYQLPFLEHVHQFDANES